MARTLLVLEDEAHAAELRDVLERAGHHCTVLCLPRFTSIEALPLHGAQLILCDGRLCTAEHQPLYQLLLTRSAAVVAVVCMSDDQESLTAVLEQPPDVLLVEPLPRELMLARLLEALRQPQRSARARQREMVRDLVDINQKLRVENERLALASVAREPWEGGPSAPRPRERLYRTLFEQTRDGVLVLNPRGLVLDLNQSAEEMLGLRRQEVLGEVLRFYRNQHPQEITSFLSHLPSGEPASLEGISLRGGGGLLAMTVRLVPTEGESRVIVVARPLARHHTVDSAVARRERQALLGAIVSGLAHEISNPTAYVQANLLFLQENRRVMASFLGKLAEQLQGSPLQDNFHTLLEQFDLADAMSETEAALLDAINGCQRIGQLVRDMKSVAQVDDEPPVEFTLDAVLTQALNLAMPVLRPRMRVSYNLGEDLPVMQGYPGKLTHTFLSLLIAIARQLGEGEVAEHELRLQVRPGGDQLSVQIIAEGLALEASPEEPSTLDGASDDSMFSESLLSSCRQTLQEHGGLLLVQYNAEQGVLLEASMPVRVQTTAEPPLSRHAPRGGRTSASMLARSWDRDDWP